MKIEEISTPCYVIDEKKLINNLEILQDIEKQTGAHVLLAQKCFAGFFEYDLIRQYISGVTASGYYEARLGYEEMVCPALASGSDKIPQNHIFAPAYKQEDLLKIAKICDHIIFNSKEQLIRGQKIIKQVSEETGRTISIGIRVNPECKTGNEHEMYDPCAPKSRMGIRTCDIDEEILDLIDGIHFHTLCEQNADALQITLEAIEEKCGSYLNKLKWINMGGGHHITRDDYDRELLIRLVNGIKEKYAVAVYLEPGEAVALNAGYLVSEVLDIVHNDMDIAILDASAACHMPDVLEVPYTPGIIGTGAIGEKKHTYRLAGNTCLSGDIIGDYSFDEPLKIGDKLIFEDMAIYSFVKNNTFNGIGLPSIAVMDADKNCKIIRDFGYEDFKGRLG